MAENAACGAPGMIDETELLQLLGGLESARVERTVSTTGTAKFSEAVCAFASDISGEGKPGYPLIVAHDKTGKPAGLQVTDELLRNLGGLASDGNILPAPAIHAYRIKLSSGEGDVAVVEVQPSDMPPVRFKGQAWIRRGPRRAIAKGLSENK
jgi:ATP-dependent DNA helicase RecG